MAVNGNNTRRVSRSCEITDPLDLWNKHWKCMADDIIHNNKDNATLTEKEIKDTLLCEIELLLNNNNRSLKHFHPMPLADMTKHFHLKNRLIQEELNYNRQKLQEEFSKMHKQLNKEQSTIFDDVVEAVESDKGGLFFVYGSGGTGKTFLWKTIISKLRSDGKIVLAVASSGIASLLLPGGRTAHSRFKIPLDVDDYTCCNISQNTELAELLRRADLIIWDEAPMNHRNVFEAVDKTVRDLMSKDNPNANQVVFGGKTVLLGGDFRQTLPVIPKGSREDVVAAALNKSTLWDKCKVFELHQNMRLTNKHLNQENAKEIEEFGNWVLKLGEGRIQTRSMNDYDEDNWIQIPEDLLIFGNEEPIKQMIDNTYPNIDRNFMEENYLRDRCILTPTNDCVDEVNTEILSRIPTESRSYTSADTVSPITEPLHNQAVDYPTEYLNTLQVSGMPNHLLNLKKNIPVMLMRNINPSKGLCNGTRLIVKEFEDKVINAQIITGNNIGAMVTIHRIVMCSPPTKWEFIMRRRQFPIRPCFAMTINKSQGQTLRHVGLYLERPVFSHGQLYVAVSRTTSRSGLKILIKEDENNPKGCTKNIVYPEVFNNLPKRKQQMRM